MYLVLDQDRIYRIHQFPVYYIPCIGLGQYYIQNLLVSGVLYTLHRTRIVLYTEYTGVRCIIYLVKTRIVIIYRIHWGPVYYIPCIRLGQYIQNTLVSGVLYTLYRTWIVLYTEFTSVWFIIYLYWTRIVSYTEYTSVRCIIYLVKDSDCIIYRIYQCLVYYIPCIGLGKYYIQNTLVSGVLYTLYRTRIVLYTEFKCPVYYIPCIRLRKYIQNSQVSSVLYTVYWTQRVYTEYTSVRFIIYLRCIGLVQYIQNSLVSSV